MKSIIIAILATLILATSALAQDSTPLGRWVWAQPASVRQAMGCDLPAPYSRYCWRHFVQDGRIVKTRYYRQEYGQIVMWEVRNP